MAYCTASSGNAAQGSSGVRLPQTPTADGWLPRTPTGLPLEARVGLLEAHSRALGDMWASMRQELVELHRRVDRLEQQLAQDVAELRQAVDEVEEQVWRRRLRRRLWRGSVRT